MAASSLQNWSSFDGTVITYTLQFYPYEWLNTSNKKPSVIPASGIKSDGNSYRFDINPDHTHFLIYDDSRQAKTPPDFDLNMFRDQIETLFVCLLSYYRRRRVNASRTKGAPIFFLPNTNFKGQHLENK